MTQNNINYCLIVKTNNNPFSILNAPGRVPGAKLIGMNKFPLIYLLIVISRADGQDSAKPWIKIPQANLFCQLNQWRYNAGDTILWASYTMNYDDRIIAEQNTVYVMLIDPFEHKVLTHSGWFAQDGLSHGKLKIPDTLDAGYYWFMAYTNYMIEHGGQPVFKQLILVTNGRPPFTITMDTTEEKADSIYIHYKIGTYYKGIAAGGRIQYELHQEQQLIAKGETSIDAFGEAMIGVDRKNIIMDYEMYKHIEVAFIVTRGTERQRFVKLVHWTPKTMEVPTKNN